MRGLIVFSGLDCSGKSTQIALLESKLREEQKSSFIFWSRGGYTPGFQLLKDIYRYSLGKKAPKVGFTEERKRAFANSNFLRLWLAVALIDLFLFYVIVLRIKRVLGNIVICDRYLYDTYIDFKLAYSEVNFERWYLWRVLNLLSPSPEYHFISTVPVNVSIERSKMKFEPYPDSPETLEERLRLYFEYIDKENVIHIDGCEDKKVVTKQINDMLFE